MTAIPTDRFDIVIRDETWQLIPQTTRLTVEPAFSTARGSGILEYLAEFGEPRKLPGTRLSIEHVRAVMIGFDAKLDRWRLGLHVALVPQTPAYWAELARWPTGNNVIYAAAAQQAGRELAEYIGCPLKVFGTGQLAPAPTASEPTQVRATGPLLPNQRDDISPQRVELFARSVKLPVQYPNMWIGDSHGNIMLKLDKEAAASKQNPAAPPFCQMTIDTKNRVIRLLPPTGLLNALFGNVQGREIKASDVRNVELRHMITREHVTQPEERDHKLLREVTFTHYTWEVWLTLPGESLLIAQTTHSTGSELSRQRAMAGDKFAVNTQAGIDYLRQHQADQEAYENAENYAWAVAIVIAGQIGVHVIKTEVSPDAD